MKKIIAIIGVLVLGTTSILAQEGYDKFEVQVDGLGCPFCAYGLEKKFKEFKGIKDVEIDIETGIFTFSYPAEKKLTMADVESQVKKAGYTPVAGGVTRSTGEIEAMHTEPQLKVAADKQKSATTHVAGNCEMCKARIEKAAMEQPGVLEANWDKNSKQLQVVFDQSRTSLEAVEKAVAKAGHDTDNHKAHDESYNNLPGCCHYERIEPKVNQK